MRALAVAIVLVAGSALGAASAVAGDFDLAKSRYEEAAYEDALKLLDAVETSTARDRVQVEQYRALCHIALGHADQAERAVIALVDADPTYCPRRRIASPKVLAIVAEARSRHMPVVARKLLDSGRAAFAEKNMALAAEHFSLLLKLLDEPAMADRPERADFRTLAQGFAALASAPAPTKAALPPAAAPAPTPEAAPTSGAAGAPRAAAAKAFTPAVPLEETLPPWRPPNPTIGRNGIRRFPEAADRHRRARKERDGAEALASSLRRGAARDCQDLALQACHGGRRQHRIRAHHRHPSAADLVERTLPWTGNQRIPIAEPHLDAGVPQRRRKHAGILAGVVVWIHDRRSDAPGAFRSFSRPTMGG